MDLDDYISRSTVWEEKLTMKLARRSTILLFWLSVWALGYTVLNAELPDDQRCSPNFYFTEFDSDTGHNCLEWPYNCDTACAEDEGIAGNAVHCDEMCADIISGYNYLGQEIHPCGSQFTCPASGSSETEGSANCVVKCQCVYVQWAR